MKGFSQNHLRLRVLRTDTGHVLGAGERHGAFLPQGHSKEPGRLRPFGASESLPSGEPQRAAVIKCRTPLILRFP